MTELQIRDEKLKAIRDELISGRDLPLYEYRLQNKYFPVAGEGSHMAKIMFIGEAPGKNEAISGRPFCGAAGRILDEALAHIQMERGSVYITNVVKDRPPENRDPLPDEIAAYAPYLERQIEIIRPKVIATLGRFSSAYIMEKFGLAHKLKSISQIHGRGFKVKTDYGEVNIMPMYHPAATIYDRAKREDFFRDFETLKKIISD